MVTLALNAATEHMSAAILTKSGTFEVFETGPTLKAENLLALISKVMNQAGVKIQDLTAVAIAIGPGAFTGLRLSLVTAKTLALELKIPLVPVSTLAALANQYLDKAQGRKLRIVLTACRGDVSTALFASDGSRLQGDKVIKAEAVPRNSDEVVLTDPKPSAASLSDLISSENMVFDKEAILALTPRYSHESRVNYSSKPELQHLKIGVSHAPQNL